MFVSKDSSLNECYCSFIAIFQRIINVFLFWLRNKGAGLHYFSQRISADETLVLLPVLVPQLRIPAYI